MHQLTRNDVASIERVFIFEETKTGHELHIDNLSGAIRVEVILDIRLLDCRYSRSADKGPGSTRRQTNKKTASEGGSRSRQGRSLQWKESVQKVRVQAYHLGEGCRCRPSSWSLVGGHLLVVRRPCSTILFQSGIRLIGSG